MTAELVWTEDVLPEWIDYNGHLSEAYYVLVLGHATDAFMVHLGMTPAYLQKTATSLFTLEAHVRYLDQVPPGASLEVRSAVIGVTAKLVWMWHEMFCEGWLRASEEVLMVHVDTSSGRSSAMPEELRRRVEALLMPVPEHASRRISVTSR